MLELRGLQISRRDATGDERRVLQALTTTIAQGRRVALLGPNGAGKTSLLLALVGALEFDGIISLNGRELTRASLKQHRREVGFVFSNPADQLLTERVDDEVAFGLRGRKLLPAEAQARVQQTLGAVGLSGFEARRPLSLSLGEQRRLALGTALVLEPELLLVDEPTANLDPVARDRVLDCLAKTRCAQLWATHDLPAARELCEDAILLRDGRVVAQGPVGLLEDAEVLEAAGLASRRKPVA